MYLYDYHMHSNHSTDGKDSIMKMCSASQEKGMKEIAITDHFEPTLGNEHYPNYNAKKYFGEIAEANELFANKMKVKAGVELGQPHIFPEYSLKLIEANNYDYVLASAHKMADNTDFGDLNYEESNLSMHCVRYLDELKSLALWNKFDCIGHLDLVKRYASRVNLNARLIDFRDRLEEILQIIIRSGKGIEVNTSGLRQSANECMPGIDILSLYKQMGGEIITIGSDAHNNGDVGKGITDAIEILSNVGFNYTTVFEKREPRMVKNSNKSTIYYQARRTA